MTEKKQDQDTLQRFIFESHQVRGVIVRLNATYQAALAHHDYNATTSKFVGELLTASALLAATIKFKGKLTLQIQGKGPLKILLAQANESLHLRGLAMTQGSVRGGFNKVVGEGHLLINIDPLDAKERYQAVTAISGKSIASTIEHYFAQSEQLSTKLWIFADCNQAVGLLLQKMPDKTQDETFWEHITTLTSTITEKELLNLSNNTILHRLFHEEDLRLFESSPVCFRCQCSIEKMEDVLLQLGEKESLEIIGQDGHIEVTCDFCNQCYHFDAIDVTRIFLEKPAMSSPEHKQ